MNEIKRRKEISNLRKELRNLKQKYEYASKKSDVYYKAVRNLDKEMFELQDKISKLQHKFRKGDFVLLKNGGANSDGLTFSVAQIRKLIGAKQYEVFEYFPNGRVGTTPKIDESRIVCPIQSIFGLAEFEVIIIKKSNSECEMNG